MADATSKLNILVKVQDEASAALRHLSNDVSDLGGSLNFTGMKAGILAGAMAAIAGAAIWQSIKAFEEAEVQMAKFEAIMKTLSPELQKYRERILETANAAMKLGFNNEIAAVSIARLFQATGDAEFAFRAFQAAMDLARYKGISLEDATTALILAFQGGGRLLKQFGIEVDEHASKETILAAVMKQTQGQAKAYAETLKGNVEVMKQYKNEVFEIIGQPFADTIKTVKDRIMEQIDAWGGLDAMLDKIRVISPILGGILVGIVGGGLAEATLRILIFLGSFGEIVAVIGAVISVFALFYVFITEMIVPMIEHVILKVKEFGGVWNYLKDVWKTSLDFIKTDIMNDFGWLINWVKDQYDKIISWVNSIKSAISGVLSAVGGAVGIKGSKQFGGYIPETGAYLLHQGEYVVPSRLAGAGIGGGVINIYLQGDFYTETEMAKKFGDLLAKEIKYQLKL